MDQTENIKVEVIDNPEIVASTDYEQSLFEIDKVIDQLSAHADNLDYFVAVASGILCGMLDILWTGNFDLLQGRTIADDQVRNFVEITAKVLGCGKDDLKSSVSFLESKFPIPEDGNTPEFGGGLQHHLRDFGHHPSFLGLLFSLLTQFTGQSYGTDTNGRFVIVDVAEKSREFIGENVPEKIFRGTVIWFFHLVSDVAGASKSAALSGGTGIPGPLLSLAKEISVLPVFHDLKIRDDELSVFLSKVFNGTIFAKRDENGKIIKETVVKFDFRGELGALIEFGKQAIPVAANDVIVRSFYFIRRFASEIKKAGITSIRNLKWIDWEKCKPFDNPTIDRMMLIAAGTFSAIDIAEAVATQEYWISVNYVGLGRFTVGVGKETVNLLRLHDAKKAKRMYERIRQNTFGSIDNRIYGKLGDEMDYDKFGLTLEQTEILYNLEYYKTFHDIQKTIKVIENNIAPLKREWLDEWKSYIESGFPGFVNDKNAKIHWYDGTELLNKIVENNPSGIWFRLVLLETMTFEPYYPLSLVKNKKGASVPSSKYKMLDNPLLGFNKREGDKFLESFFESQVYYKSGYIKRLRTCYDRSLTELNETLKTALTTLGITAAVALAVVATAGALAGPVAVILVGSNFAGLSGAALTSACLAYIGGGAIAAGGAGMLGGTISIVGGGALLGVGIGAGVGGTFGALSLMNKKSTILQSAKLLVSVREIFLNDEHDMEYSNYIYEQYVNKIADIEKSLVELKLKAETASKDEQKKKKEDIKNTEESVRAMKIAMKNLNKFKSSFDIGNGQKTERQ